MTGQGSLFARLDEGFASRCGNCDLQRSAWEELAREYPPFLDRYTKLDEPLPCAAVARRSGDLGLAILWIVQAAIIRALLADLRSSGDADKIDALLGMLEHDRIASLAHSEDADHPVIAETRESTETFVKGTKKYITGGFLSDLILLTMRRAGEEKISGAAVIPAYILPDDAFEDLRMEALRSMSHTRLVLHGFGIPESDVLGIEGADLRRAIRKWGIVERALILEAFTALCLYMADRLPDGALAPSARAELETLFAAQSSAARVAYGQARSGGRVDETSSGIPVILSHAGKIRDAYLAVPGPIPEETAARLKDLDLFSHMRV